MENFKILGFHIYKLLVIIALISISECYPSFQNNIPNGNKVPNPCTADANDLWSAVGHWQPNNGGARNPFGRVSIYFLKTVFFLNVNQCKERSMNELLFSYLLFKQLK